MISDRLKTTILQTLNLPDWDITAETFAFEVPGWDSLNHVAVLCAVEKEFAIRFQSTEVLSLNNVGDLQALVDRKVTHA